MGNVIDQLELSRQELLDLSLRNTLLNYRQLKSRGVTIVDELPQEILRILVQDNKDMTFLPKAVKDDEPLPANPNRNIVGPESLLDRPNYKTSGHRRENRLQTSHSEQELQRLLLNTYYTAKTYVEEQGVNVLYLALGSLEWYESASSDIVRQAPLILVPVELRRNSVKTPFRLSYTEDDLGENLSLKAKLITEFGIRLPSLPDISDLNILDYFHGIAQAIRQEPRWRVNQEAVALGFFSFAAFLMYHDLDANEWGNENSPVIHPIMSALLGNGFDFERRSEAFWQLDEDTFIDDHVQPQDSHQVIDADSSQILAVLDVNRGLNLVIQGPPGTGKSQTITNIIAEAIGAGKKVLFVAEKMAALEVVKRRLDNVDLGDACLELHSHKTNKKTVLAELKRTLELGRPRTDDGSYDYQELLKRQQELNLYSQAVNSPVRNSGVTPYKAYGELIRLRRTLLNTGAPELTLKNSHSWSQGDFQQRLETVYELQELVQDIGPLTHHPFWGSRYLSFIPQDKRRVEEAARHAQHAVIELTRTVQAIFDHLNLPEVADYREVKNISLAVKHILAAPDLKGVDIHEEAWQQPKQEKVRTIIEAGARLEEIHSTHDAVLIPEAWKQDVLPLRNAYVTYGPKWWRIFSGDFRKAKRELAGLCQTALPNSIVSQVSLIEAVLEAQRLELELADEETEMACLFGHHWRGKSSDWTRLTAISDWLIDSYKSVSSGRFPESAISYTASHSERNTLQAMDVALDTALLVYKTAVDAAIATAKIDGTIRKVNSLQILDLTLTDQAALFSRWNIDSGRIQEIVTYNQIALRLKEEGLEEVREIAVNWAAAGHHLNALVQQAWYESIIAAAFTEHPLLNNFNSSTHEQKIESFRKLDQRQFELNRQQLVSRHWEMLPKHDAAGQLGVLKREFEKKSRHIPIRRLMERSGNVIQALKPVFMMGPLSIAMYLPPNALHFDLVVFDEASQVRPVEAFGAILRGRQAVVVGDSKQLPPTSFFESIVEEEQEEGITTDLESILGLFSAQGATQKMLRWHYRSRHESLIAISNYEFYDNKLIVFPSPSSEEDQRGLVYHYLPHTYYDRGKSSVNRLEAGIVAKAVMEHSSSHPDQSLGVVAFSIKQAQAIQDQVEILRREDPSHETFFTAHPEEPFFVKNLENVQGDERDVMFISVGYGRDVTGNLTMNFGPLNKEGGERRLNVLITRAKQRCEVFTNLKADDIDLTKSNTRGVIALKRYLKYAELRVLDIPRASGRGPDSLFEEAVAEAIRDLGYEIDYQVGSAGFFIDLAVKDPTSPGRYLLAVECDGATYHSARSARDRDRLRQQILQGLGWRIHRVWSTDWFQNPTRQVEKLKEAIETAKLSSPQAKGNPSVTLPLLNTENRKTKIERIGESSPLSRLSVQQYTVCQLKIRSTYKLHEMSYSQLVNYITQVVEVESPVHVEVVTRRIHDAAGVKRTGSRIQNSINAATDLAIRNGYAKRKGDFLWHSNMTTVSQVRNRQNLELRSLKLVAPEEIELAIIMVLTNSYGLCEDDLYSEVCNLLGLNRITISRKEQLQKSVDHMLKAGMIVIKGEYLMVKN